MGGRGSAGGGTATAEQAASIKAENKVKSAYSTVAAAPGQFVYVSAVRDHLDMPKSEADRVLKEMARQPGVHFAPQDYQGGLTHKQREGAVIIGGRPNHLISIENPAPKPIPKAKR